MGRAMAEQQARALQAVREAEQRAEKEKEAALSAAAEKQRDREQREQVPPTFIENYARSLSGMQLIFSYLSSINYFKLTGTLFI